MSARKIDSSRHFNSAPTSKTHLNLAANAVRIRKNGIEFRTAQSIVPWTEMTVNLQSPRDGKKIHCTGVIVACNGSRHAGYIVSMLFTNLTRQSQEVLNSLAQSRLA